MNTLEGVRDWHRVICNSLAQFRRLGDKYWDELPWAGRLGRDDRFRTLEARHVTANVDLSRQPLDDLAVALLFSVFEATVRHLVATQVEREATSLTHPLLVAAAKDTVKAINKRAFAQVLSAYSKGGHADLAEQVRQVRRYRNWVTHGRRGAPGVVVDPTTAYKRLRAFLDLVTKTDPGTSATAEA